MDAQTYRDHLAACEGAVASALERSAAAGRPFDGVALHAGSHRFHHRDDQEVPFRPDPHFARFAPLNGPGHVVLVAPGRATRLVRFAPADFWGEPAPSPEHPCLEALEAGVVETEVALREALPDLRRWAYVGNDPAAAAAFGIPPDAVEPQPLLAALDWGRAEKTAYEVACLREAARRAGAGHGAVRRGVALGLSERELHGAYLEATGHLESETPYGNIIAWDEASAVLHYQTKRTAPPSPGGSFLIDAGATHLGYASDITRTYVRAGCHDVFAEAVRRLYRLQDDLVAAVRPGLDYVAFHELAYRGVGEVLCDLGILTVDADVACERDMVFPFFPHGLGHHLGLQVHDVAGRQTGPDGGTTPPPDRFPFLRTTRPLAAGHVVTVEPGLYFVPVLLEPRRGEEGFAWDLIDALAPHGGVRVEDDVLVTADGVDNLSRPFVPASPEPGS